MNTFIKSGFTIALLSLLVSCGQETERETATDEAGTPAAETTQEQTAQQTQEQETDQYGRTPDDPHYGHNHPPLEEQGATEVQEAGEEQAADGDGPVMEFEETVHDFGTIPDNTKVTHRFEFTNSGNSPLVINNVRAGCGCTAPSYSDEPVQPGETGYVEVQYDSGFRDVETFNQGVTVEANTAEGSHRVSVRGNIDKN